MVKYINAYKYGKVNKCIYTSIYNIYDKVYKCIYTSIYDIYVKVYNTSIYDKVNAYKYI